MVRFVHFAILKVNQFEVLITSIKKSVLRLLHCALHRRVRYHIFFSAGDPLIEDEEW